MKGMKPFMQQGYRGRIIHIEIGWNGRRSENCGYVGTKWKEEAGIVWRMERYGQRMNELMNLDSDAHRNSLIT